MVFHRALADAEIGGDLLLEQHIPSEQASSPARSGARP
jgi:hypothetical protein